MSLLQDTIYPLDTLAGATQQTVELASDKISLIGLLFKAGWIMIPLLLLLFATLVVFIERYITIKKASKYDPNLMSHVKQSVLSGRLDSALSVCRTSNSALGRMLEKGLVRIGRPIKDIEGAIENIGKLEVARLEKNLNILSIIAGVAPMLGFVGTIFGVIIIFRDVEAAGGIDIASVSGGLYVKMIASAAGLTIGILAFAGYHWLNTMLERLILRIETDAIEFVDLLDEPGS
ncbi:MotA/TolQ/ExbB proton channel family protein [Parapedobacter sp. 10938]|uniref:MotA/TolQ/ExbB proton channel family protein n=1 Tax=Parapedobacter flavus TaxID=3110225 RepID=UPI002DB707D4|nr:MotA/TolQ/ExbB proton channel family protein [Parapedobacter sp. 10938]MEC3879019.1 MotA/TolQ/ExbB proton channel family protein [Parapedobacter sp. 10938]